MSSGPSSVKSPWSASEVKQTAPVPHFICDEDLGLVYHYRIVFNDASWILLPRLQLRFRLTVVLLEVGSTATGYSLPVIWGTHIMSWSVENKVKSCAVDCKLFFFTEILSCFMLFNSFKK